MIVSSTKYPDLVRFIFPHLRYMKVIPLQDGFFMIRDLINSDLRTLEQFHEYVIVSQYFAEQDWGRQEIVDFVCQKIRTRRKPKFDWMTDGEFVDSVKLLYVANMWPEFDQHAVVFELFKNIDSYKRVETYFKLRQDLSPYEIFYSILTFVRRCFDENVRYEVSPGYLRVIESKSTIIKKNFNRSIKAFARQGDIDQDFKALSFISSLGEIT